MWNLEILTDGRDTQAYQDVILITDMHAPYERGPGHYCLVARDKDDSVLGALVLGVHGFTPTFTAEGLSVTATKGQTHTGRGEDDSGKLYINNTRERIEQTWIMRVVNE